MTKAIAILLTTPLEYVSIVFSIHMEGNLTEEVVTGRVRFCNDFQLVTFYPTSAATGTHLYSNIVVLVLIAIFVLFGTVANFLVIFLYVKNGHLRTTPNVLILFLACSDLLTAAVVAPLFGVRILKEFRAEHDCFLLISNRSLSYISSGMSVATVAVISVERYVTLAYPFRSRFILTRSRLKLILACLWLFTLTLTICHFYLLSPTAFLSIAVFIVLSCVLVITSTWLWIFRLIRRHRKSIEATSNVLARRTTHCKHVFKNTRTSYFIVVGVLFCYLPLAVVLVYYSMAPKSFALVFFVSPWAEILVLSNSMFNPILVFWRKSDFRNTARQLLF